MSTVASLAEQNQAKLFLRLIGAPTTDNQLVLAVVALVRVSGAGFDVRDAAARLLKGSVYTAPPMPSWARSNPIEWTDYLRQLQDTAKEYKLILAAARNDLASDFLYALALSSWDLDHFGGWSGGTITVSRNRLLTTYSRFTGLTMPAPKPTPPIVPRPIPVPPKVLRAPAALPRYVDPWAAQGFYDARHHEKPRTLDTVALGE